MIRLSVPHDEAEVRIEINIANTAVRTALEQRGASPLLRCAIATVLSALALGDEWPDRALCALAGLLEEMKQEVIEERMH